MKLKSIETGIGVPVLAVLVSGAVATGAEAYRQGTVTACSQYGNGCLTVPVRQGRWGPEMRLRGGTWIDCRGSCIDTLREDVVDFWETQREKGGRTK